MTWKVCGGWWWWWECKPILVFSFGFDQDEQYESGTLNWGNEISSEGLSSFSVDQIVRKGQATYLIVCVEVDQGSPINSVWLQHRWQWNAILDSSLLNNLEKSVIICNRLPLAFVAWLFQNVFIRFQLFICNYLQKSINSKGEQNRFKLKRFLINSAGAGGGPRSRACARLTWWLEYPKF